jgi:hypothetical protein
MQFIVLPFFDVHMPEIVLPECLVERLILVKEIAGSLLFVYSAGKA